MISKLNFDCIINIRIFLTMKTVENSHFCQIYISMNNEIFSKTNISFIHLLNRIEAVFSVTKAERKSNMENKKFVPI